MSWRRLPRPPWPLPPTRTKVLEGLKSQVAWVPGKDGSNRQSLDKYGNAVNRVKSLIRGTTHTKAASVAFKAIVEGHDVGNENVRAAIAVKICKHLAAQHGADGAREFVLQLMGTGENAECAIPPETLGMVGGYHHAVAVALQALAREGKHNGVLELFSRTYGGGNLPSTNITNRSLQLVFGSLKHVGDLDVVTKSWDALTHAHNRRETRVSPSAGTFTIFLRTCVQMDLRQKPGRTKSSDGRQSGVFGLQTPSIFDTGTCTRRALDILGRFGYEIDSPVASSLLEGASSARDVGMVMRLHRAQGKPAEVLQDIAQACQDFEDEGERDALLLMEVMDYRASVEMTSSLLTSLVKALIRCGCKREAFGVLQCHQKTQDGVNVFPDYFKASQPFDALVRNAEDMWSVFGALGVMAQAWHAPSNRSIRAVIHKIAEIEEQAYARDFWERFPIHELIGLEGAYEQDSNCGDLACGDGLKLSESILFSSNIAQMKQERLWQIWKKYMLPIVNGRSVRDLLHCLHKSGASDDLVRKRLMQVLRSAAYGEHSPELLLPELADNCVIALMHHKIMRKDLTLGMVSVFGEMGIVLSEGAVVKAAQALDSKQRVTKIGNVASVMKAAVSSDTLDSPELEQTLTSSLQNAFSTPEKGRNEGAERVFVNLGLWRDKHYRLLTSGPACEQVVAKLVAGILDDLRDSRKHSIAKAIEAIESITKTQI